MTKNEENKYNVKDLQNAILKIFKYFDSICEENDLKYYAIGGTCIGAVRHKGFIPWDDDLDVAMPIDDYLKFRNIMLSKKDNNNYGLVDYLDNTRKYKLQLFLKLEDINTTFVEDAEIKDKNSYKGVYIDIMPLCSISKNKFKRFLLLKKLRIYMKLNRTRNFSFDFFDTFKGKLGWLVLRLFTLFKKQNYYYTKIEKELLKHKLNKNDDVCFAWRNPPRRKGTNLYSYDIFENYEKLPFEDTFIRCPIKYHDYLSKDFGDYQVIPEKDKQKVHSHALLDLEKSYIEYKKGDI